MPLKGKIKQNSFLNHITKITHLYTYLYLHLFAVLSGPGNKIYFEQNHNSSFYSKLKNQNKLKDLSENVNNFLNSLHYF